MLIRKIHRWLSMPMVLFLFLVIVTGIYLQFVELQHGLETPKPLPMVTSLPSDEVVLQQLQKALLIARQADQNFPAEKLQLTYLNGQANLTLETTNRLGPSLSVNLNSGEVKQVERPPRTLRTFFLLFHSGKFFGTFGTIVMLLCGLVLLVLSVTGTWEYVQMYKRRRNGGKKSFFW